MKLNLKGNENMKRFLSILLSIVVVISSALPVYACDENQNNTYVTQILFGDNALSYGSDENVKILLDALYLCSEQSDNQGQDKIEYLKQKKVRSIPNLKKLNIKNNALEECSHNFWEYEYKNDLSAQENRKKVLQNGVNKVFDFGTFNNWFGSRRGKCNSFAALLYYSHILSDYLADNPSNTETSINGREISSYAGQAYVEINGGRPSFTAEQKKYTKSFYELSPLDSLGRCGVAFANIGSDLLAPPGSRQNIGNIKPSGWNQQKYDGVVNSEPAYLYNRCHLIAHQLIGVDTENNLITGTRYLNETGMKPIEDDIVKYIQETNNHVLYRATPVFSGDNKVASGVQLEAYSVEDNGKGICYNYYCYNVQPGININYSTGENSLIDSTLGNDDMIPFAVSNPSDDNPDLMYEMNKHLEILFKEQKKSSSGNYNMLIGDINNISYEARKIVRSDEKDGTKYLKLKKCEYEYFEALKTYIPLLLKNEKFFKSAFK